LRTVRHLHCETPKRILVPADIPSILQILVAIP
jgi:hypothetical protein